MKARAGWPVLAVAVVAAALWVAKPLLLPLALALLGSVVLAPLVHQMERLHLGRIPAVIVVTLLASASLAGAGWLLAEEGAELASDLPQYRRNARIKLHSLVVGVEEAARQVKEIEREIADTAGGGGKGDAPKVDVVNDGPGALELARTYGGSVAGGLTTAGLAIVFLMFILVQWEDLRDRVVRVLGARDLHLATELMGDATGRVTRYLRTYALLNLGHGVVVGLGLWLFGLPAAALFGVVAALARFVPYVGPWVAATLPVALSIAVFESWVPTLGVALFLAAVELVSNNVAEPWLYGSSVGLSPFAVVVSAVFWTWLWGPVGVVLATPLSVCLVVLGRGLPSLEFLAVLLGDEPALSPSLRVYQRLLARDPEEARRLLERYARERGLDATWDEALLPALALLERDWQEGRLERSDVEAAAEALEGLVAPGAPPEPEAPREAERPAAMRVLCLPAVGPGDAIACRLLARSLAAHGVAARSSDGLERETRATRAAREGAELVCVFSLSGETQGRVGALVRRLLERCRALEVVVVLWEAGRGSAGAHGAFAEGGRVRLASDLSTARDLVLERVRERAGSGASEAPGTASAEAAGPALPCATGALAHPS